MYGTVEVVGGLAFLCGRNFEPIKELRPGDDVGFVDGDEQRLVLRVASDLITTAGPDVDCIDGSVCIFHTRELREDVRF